MGQEKREFIFQSQKITEESQRNGQQIEGERREEINRTENFKKRRKSPP